MNSYSTLLALLTGATLAAALTAEASVQVHGEATSTGPTIQVQVFADITDPPMVSHSFRLQYPARDLTVVAATGNDAVWFFHDGVRRLPAPAPDTSIPGTIILVGGRFDARQPRGGVTGHRVLLGTVVFARTSKQTPDFGLRIGWDGRFASFVTADGAVLDTAPGVVTWRTVDRNADDQDLDGLGDAWEEKYFGSTKEAFYSDDGDRDGVTNLGEEAMGSDPTDPRSLLRLDLAAGKETWVLEWPSADGRTYTLEGAKELGRFQVLQEGIASTPPRNTLELKRAELPDTVFFRVRVDVDGRR